MTRREPAITGVALLCAVVLAAAVAPLLTTGSVTSQHPDFILAPPMLPRVVDASGTLRAPFIYPLVLEDRLSHTYSLDLAHPRPLCWFCSRRLISVDGTPWFPLGTDRAGRDVLARLAAGARLSLGIALTAAAIALLAGAAIGGLAGMLGGAVDAVAMRVADFVVTLPALYVVLALRASLPLSLPTSQVFWTIAGVLAAVGWPMAARGVRAVVAVERTREYAEAARAAGAGRTRILLRHLLPASFGFLATQAILLVPAFILAEATLSFVGFGFPDGTATWGGMLRDASEDIGSVVRAPWLLAPALAIVTVVFAINLIAAPGFSPQTRSVAGK